MFDQIFNNDSIHTQNAYDVEIRMRTREEQRFMLAADLGTGKAEKAQLTGSPSKVNLVVLFLHPTVLFQALVGSIGK